MPTFIPSDSAAARGELERMLALDVTPVLTSSDVDALLLAARRPDSSGLTASDAGWTATYDLQAAAADGWEIRAGRAAGAIDFGEDGQRFNRSQLYAQCMAMAALYRRGSGSARVTSIVDQVAVP